MTLGRRGTAYFQTFTWYTFTQHQSVETRVIEMINSVFTVVGAGVHLHGTGNSEHGVHVQRSAQRSVRVRGARPPAQSAAGRRAGPAEAPGVHGTSTARQPQEMTQEIRTRELIRS